MPNLYQYLVKEHGISLKEINPGFNSELNQVLRSTIVEPTRSDLQHVSKIPYKQSYLELIDDVIRYMLTHKVSNCLIDGYVNNTLLAEWTHSNYNPHTSFKVNILKSAIWQQVYNIIGRNCFLILILSCKIYVKTTNGTYFQICGKEIVNQFQKPAIVADFTPNSDILPTDPSDMLQEIIGSKSSPKFNGLIKICTTIHRHHLKCNYFAIQRKLVSGLFVADETSSVVKSSLHEVIKFFLVINQTMVDKRVWGSSRNQKLFKTLLTDYIKTGEKVWDNIPSFSIQSLDWLGKNRRVSTIEDLNMRKQVFKQFLNWYIGIFMRRIIHKLWKRIQVNVEGKDMMEYYPIRKWRVETQKWIDDYASTYLYSASQEFTKPSNLENNFTGTIKLVPKTQGFRMICIPLRARPLALDNSVKEESIRYSQHIKKFIKPLQFLLNSKDRELATKTQNHHVRSFSSQDVARHINDFRLRINVGSQDLHFVKFDMKHCYDNIVHSKLLESVANLFQDDYDDKPFYVRQIKETFMFSKQKDRYKFMLKDVNNVDEFDPNMWTLKPLSTNMAISDKCYTTRLTKKMVVDAIEDYVKNSGIFLRDVLFKRQIGIFQGFPLSSTLCNIFYNQLVDEKLSYTFNQPSPSILIRLVDDFLFISTDKELCKRVYDTVGTEFRDHGGFINESKTAWIQGGISRKSQILKFVGLDIDVKDLTVKSQNLYDPRNLALSKCHNYKDFYQFIIWWYKAQFKDYLIDLKFNSFANQFGNLEKVWKLLINVIIRLMNTFKTKGMVISVEKHSEFLMDLCHITLTQWSRYNGSDWNNQIFDIFVQYLEKHRDIDENISTAMRVLYNV